MQINADFSRRVVIRPDQYQWTASPLPGVERVMLDRVGGELARATSLVRYAPGSSFTAHAHPGGEEILVLDGVFSDGVEDYPAGTYLRNPPGSVHQPSSAVGALLFVKLMQMKADEHQRVCVQTFDPQGNGSSRGLFEDDDELVELARLGTFEAYEHSTFNDGAELLLLKGQLSDESGAYPAGTWLRLPVGSHAALRAGEAGAVFYLKAGHLALMVGREHFS